MLTRTASDLMDSINRTRHVRMRVFYMAANDMVGEDGEVHQDFSREVMSPNFLTMPELIDEIDTTALEQMRKFWLEKLDEEKKLGGAPAVDQAFVSAAKYPVPAEYRIDLPVGENSGGLRGDIIATLVPFKEARSLLLRMERKLELPMRQVDIAHSPIGGVEDVLNATMQ